MISNTHSRIADEDTYIDVIRAANKNILLHLKALSS